MFSWLKKYPEPLRKSILEGSFAALMTGGAMAFIVPFAVFLGANVMQVGILISLPAFLAAWFQIASIKILGVCKKKKKIVFYSITFQAISWLAIGLLPLIFPTEQITWLIALTTAGTVIGSLGNPFWQSWMRSLTPNEIIGEYFGIRNALIGVVVFITTLSCGYLLKVTIPSTLLYTFIAIFIISFLGRLASAYWITKIEEPEQRSVQKTKNSVFGYILHFQNKNFGRFILFGTLMSFSIALTAPYVSFYFLEGLNLKNNYLMYTTLISAAMVTTLISLPYWGRIMDKYGTIKLLKATGFLVCFYPLGLILIRDPFWLIFVELFDGVIFSSFNLALANFVYESFKPEKILYYAAIQTALFGTAAFAGAMLSGALQSTGVTIGFLSSSFLVICLVSMSLRLASFFTTIWKVRDIRETKFITISSLRIRAITLVPVTKFFEGNMGFVLGTTGKKIGELEAIAAKEINKAEKEVSKELQKAQITTLEGIKKAAEFTKKNAQKIENELLNKKRKK